METEKKYATAPDLAIDERFRTFVLEPNNEITHYWNAWQQQGSEHEQVRRKQLMNEARMLVVALKPVQTDIPHDAQERTWQRIQAQISSPILLADTGLKPNTSIGENPLSQIHSVEEHRLTQEQEVTHKARILPLYLQKRASNWYGWVGVAAALLIIIGLGGLWKLSSLNSANVLVSTSDGGSRSTLTLPDGSVVIVGERSELTYSSDVVKNGAIREVMLQGEAYFKIIPTERDGEKVKFRVRTETALIEVLGTQFNVNTRRGQTAVVLQEGKVRVLSLDGKREFALLKPGERIEIGSEGVRSLREVKPELYTSWKDGKVFFEALPMAEVAAILHDSYNITLVFGDSTLVGKQFSGGVSANNISLLKEILQETFRVKVQQHNDTLFLLK